MKRVTITMPDETYRGVREAIESGEAPNVSAFITKAANTQLRETSMVELLDQLDARLGPPSDEDVQWARRVLDR